MKAKCPSCRRLITIVGVPDSIIDKDPSAGVFRQHTRDGTRHGDYCRASGTTVPVESADVSPRDIEIETLSPAQARVIKTLRTGGRLHNNGIRIWIVGPGVRRDPDDRSRREGRGVALRTLRALERRKLVERDGPIEIGVPVSYRETRPA